MSSVVLVPYWLSTPPYNLGSSDNYWWFEPVQTADIIIYGGPFIPNERWDCQLSGKPRLAVKTPGLSWRLEDLSCFLSINGLSISSISLVWHVIEVTATCRITDLSEYPLLSYAMIGDTHHLHSPISSLVDYLIKSKYSAIFCTQSHHCFFFGELTNIPVFPFPYVVPTPCSVDHGHSPIHSNHRLLYTGSILSSCHIERSRVVNYALAHDFLDLAPRMPWHQWLEFLSKDCKRVLSWSLNSNFSPQVMYPLYYGNVLFTDPIAPANWLGHLLLEHKLCHLASSAYDLVQCVKNYQEKLRLGNDLFAESLMTRRSSRLIADSLNKLSDVQEVMLNHPTSLSELMSFSTGSYQLIADLFKYIAHNRGLAHCLRLLYLFEKLQFITSRHSLVYLQIDDTSWDPDMRIFIQALPKLLPRLTLDGSHLLSLHQARGKEVILSDLIV
jgi:hypothetical protein